MEGELINGIIRIVRSHNALELEGNRIADVVVGGILQTRGGSCGIVGIHDLLFGGNFANLGADGRGPDNLYNVQAVGFAFTHGALILNQVVAGGDGQRIPGGYCAESLSIQIYILFDFGQLLKVTLAVNGSQSLQNGLIDRSSFRAGAVFAPFYVGQDITGQITGENLVNRIGAGAALGSGNGGVLRRGGSSGQGKNHDQCQEDAGDF